MSDRLTANQSMANDTPLVCADGRYAAYLQSDANLVLCHTTNGAPDLSRPYWSCAGTLVPVLPEGEILDRPLYALYAPGGQTLTRVQLFLDFVTDWCRRQTRNQKTAPVQSVKSA
jgi:hypothetical protein